MKPGQGFARRVRLETLQRFAPLLGRLPGAEQEPGTDAATGAEQAASRAPEGPKTVDPRLAEAEELFAGTPVRVSVPFPRLPRAPASPRQRPGALLGVHGDLLWQKRNLPASDLQRQQGNPTGGLRLTQARWQVGRGPIDQTTYFGDQVFGGLSWRQGSQAPLREDAQAFFDVTLLGVRYGLYRLRISHKPSGEAGQGNYTTILHWGDLGPVVQSLDLLGRTFSLYAPPPGEPEPFFLEIA